MPALGNKLRVHMSEVNMTEATWISEEKPKGRANACLANTLGAHIIVSGIIFIHSLLQLGRLF